MKNPIAERIADFLKQFHPFKELKYEDILTVSKNCSVLYLEKNQILFNVNDKTHTDFYVVANGAIGLSVTSDTDDILIDKCDEGDILGLRPFFAKDNYLMTAKAREESIVYAIPIETFKPIAMQNTDVLDFLLQSFASNTRNPLDKNNKGKLISENVIYDDASNEIQFFQPINYTKNPVTASPHDIVKFVAQTMSSRKIGSIIIQEKKLPVGIVTDKDLRSKIATGLFSIDTPINKIMSSPVITVPENLSIAEAQISMLKNNVGHLCVTKDGSNQSEITGIISEHDVVVAQANNPGVLIKETKRAEKTDDLVIVRRKLTDLIQNSIDKNIPINHICSLTGEINNAIIKKCIDLSIEKIGTPPPAQFAWMNIGSQGRQEQLLLTDQDNAIIFEDVPEEYSRQQMTTEFGNRVVQMVEDVTKDDSIKDWRKRSDAYLDHVKQSPDESIIVCASDKISNISAVLSDYKKVGEELWDRFASSKTDQLWWYKSVLEIVESRLPKSILVKELATRIEKLNCIINP